jgi:tetratricopeptide (TPR) repeat protein
MSLLDPRNPSYAGKMGMLLFYQGREKEALEHWNKTMELAPYHTHVYMTEYFLSKHDFASAIKHYDAAKTLRPSHPWVIWMGGYLLAKKGDKEGALNTIRHIRETRVQSATIILL